MDTLPINNLINFKISVAEKVSISKGCGESEQCNNFNPAFNRTLLGSADYVYKCFTCNTHLCNLKKT